jgi:hypothetical protein
VSVTSVTTLASVFHIGEYVGYYAGGLSEMCHKCVINVWIRLSFTVYI